MRYSFYAKLDIGQVRPNNEDSVSFDAAYRVGVLADGMGGYQAGEVASSMATSMVQSELVRWLASGGLLPSARQLARAMDICVHKANQAILDKAMSNTAYTGMGTTVVVGAFQPSTLVLAHVGDSRCYRWRRDNLTRLTRDHSINQQHIDAGLLTPEQAAVAPGRNLLTRALGVREPMEVEIHEHAVESNDLYLMCSDGLTEMLSDQQIAHVLAQDASLERLARTLINEANARGGRDNIAVLLVRAYSQTQKPSLVAKLFG